MLIVDLIRQSSDLTCDEGQATAIKLPFTRKHPTVWKTKSVPAAESNLQAFEPADVLRPSTSSAVETPECTSLRDDCLVTVSLSSSPASPCTDSSCSKPVDGDLQLKLDTAAAALAVDGCLSNAVADISDMSKTLSSHSAGHDISHESSGSDEVFVTRCSQNSLSVEPLSSVGCVTVPQHNGRDMLLASNSMDADAAFEFGQIDANKAFETSPLQQLRCSLFDDIFFPSSPSESESEPFGGCNDALLNPDHCISDLCLEDNDDDSIFGAAGFQSVSATDSVNNYNNSVVDNPLLLNAGDSCAMSVMSNRVKRDCSDLNVSSLSKSYSLKPCVELHCGALVFDKTQTNSSTSPITSSSPFRSPPKSSVRDETNMYRCTVPRSSSSPFMSPPKSTASILEAKWMWNKTTPVEDLQTTEMLPFESAMMLPSCSTATEDIINTERTINCTSSPDVTYDLQCSGCATDSAVLPASLNSVTGEDMSVVAVSDTVFECRSSPLLSRCDEYKPDWTSESSAAAVQRNKTPVNVVECSPSESGVCCPRVDTTRQNGSLLHSTECHDVYSMDRKAKQTSVKELKCKFESQQDSLTQIGARSSPEKAALAVVPHKEPNASCKLQTDSTCSASPYMKKWEDILCSEITDSTAASFPNLNGVRDGYSEHNSECNSNVSVYKTVRVPVRDLKQCQPSSVSTRISCFEPVMSSGCQKENKRARLSSSGSAVLDDAETKLNSTSHSVKDISKSHQNDADGWFVESPQRGRAKQYQRCSSAGHEDLLALLNIPASSAKSIPRLSERKRMFETETAVPKVNSSDSVSLVASKSPAFECDQYLCGTQKLLSMDKENSLHGYESNCQGRVKTRRSLFEGNFACSVRNDSVDRESSIEVDYHSFKYPVN